jgi:hypothetical protein
MNMDALELCSSWPSYAEGHRVAASDVGFRIRAAAATPRAPFCYAACALATNDLFLLDIPPFGGM